MNSDREIIKAYDAIAGHYEEYSSNFLPYLESVESQVIQRLDADMRLLDLGAGDGRRLLNISKAVNLREIIAVEPSAEMAKVCRTRTGLDVKEMFGEDLDQLNIGKFNVITALWNIFGHIPTSNGRLKTLKNLNDKLETDGFLMLDVNNRHNQLAYGRWSVFKRRLLDSVFFNEKRGDAKFEWVIGNEKFKTSGHLFIPGEIEKLFVKAGFKISESFSINYATGKLSNSLLNGQLFYVLVKF